jgi:hypothetical protein
MSTLTPLSKAAAPGYLGPRDRQTLAWLLSGAGDDAEPADVADAKSRQRDHEFSDVGQAKQSSAAVVPARSFTAECDDDREVGALGQPADPHSVGVEPGCSCTPGPS